ncbi:Bis(5'-nucleosyl)-tetraphosphatase [symmetrical] [Buchnera aphidicola (Eriosoma lanigerum)]|uniref:bis(5'-nucleosyl)-tetraphosphatase (symmetrical) ApaH n=1 Tax=Buchnera aphidicola TaxID=9 RepID=UPI003464C0CF
MSTYLIGDVHGCYNQLQALLNQVSFNKDKDILWFTGDLIARGSSSLEVLQFIYSLGKVAKVVLGNHDLYLISVYSGIKQSYACDNIVSLLQHPEIEIFIDWLRNCPLVIVDEEKKLIMSHAGIFPYWNLSTALQYAREIEKYLKSDNYIDFLSQMYGDIPDIWNINLTKFELLRFSVNVFTRMRYCFLNGRLDFSCKTSPLSAPTNLLPWFLINTNIPTGYSIVFGHWSTLRNVSTPKNIISLDTGCCWGYELSMLRWEDKMYFQQSFHT